MSWVSRGKNKHNRPGSAGTSPPARSTRAKSPQQTGAAPPGAGFGFFGVVTPPCQHCGMASWEREQPPGDVRGRPLRYLLVAALIDADGPCSVGALQESCERRGVVFGGRASKVISDALRWEIAAGRVRRVQRGVYAIDRVPRSTRGWIEQRNDQTRAWLLWSAEQRASSAGAVPPTPRPPDIEVTGWVPPWPSRPIGPTRPSRAGRTGRTDRTGSAAPDP